MPTLNRFPLLGLWAEEAARRLGYRADEAQSLGHAYAVLYAIRKQQRQRPAEEEKKPAARAQKPAKAVHLSFAGDELEVVHDAKRHVRGRVGGEGLQTPATYKVSVQNKFPPGYYARLQKCFRRLFKQYPPRVLDSRLVYRLYDGWKKACAVGSRVDLDALLELCEEHVPAADADAE